MKGSELRVSARQCPKCAYDITAFNAASVDIPIVATIARSLHHRNEIASLVRLGEATLACFVQKCL